MKNRRFIVTTLVVVLCLFLLGVVWVYRIAGTALCEVEKSVSLCIDKDDNIDSVYAKMSEMSDTPRLDRFKKVSGWVNYADAVKVGRYEIGKGLSTWEVVRNLRNGIQSPIMLTIPQVWTLESLAARISKKIMADSAEIIAVLTDTATCKKYNCKPETMVCLFMPNTYEIYWTISPEKLLERMHKEYQIFWNEKRVAMANEKGLTPNEVITLASIIEKETMKQEENPIVAGLYLNRLNKGMKLQACPTVKFALKEFGLRRILNRHLQVESPYNTYKYEGLPPGPICIPSMNSIESVLNAEKHNYLYMCAKEDFSGTHNFAETGAQHEANARKYQKALNERGIKK